MTTTPPPTGQWEPQHLTAEPTPPTERQLEDLGDLDRGSRVGRTAVQVGVPAAILGIATWAARLAGLDLDPGAGVDLPADVAGYWVAIGTFAMSLRMNRTRP